MNLISVIVPIYNVEDYLAACLDSILQQTYRNIEVIAVNDGSKDGSLSILEEYAKKDDRIQIVDKPNGGLADARNAGIAVAKGDYVFCIDSDDTIDPIMFETMLNKAIEEEADYVVCDMDFIWTKENHRVVSGKRLVSTDKKSLLLGTPSACNKMLRRELFDFVEFPVGKKFEDLATMPLLLAKAKKVAYVEGGFYKYLQREGSIIYSSKPNTEDIYFVLERIKNGYEKNGWLNEFKDEIEYLFIEHILLHHCRRMLHFSCGEKEIERAVQYMNQNFKNWKSNRYMNLFTSKEKMLIHMFTVSITRKMLVKKYQ